MPTWISGSQCGHNHQLVVDHGGLEPASPSRRSLVVGRDPGSARRLPASARECFGDHEVDRYPSGVQPRTGLALVRVGVEPCVPHCFLDERLIGEGARVDGDVAVLRGLGNGDRRARGSEVDRLCTDDNDRVPLRVQRVERVKKR